MTEGITSFLTWYIALIVSLVFHEAAHAWVAFLGGDRTAYEAGQVTINPIPHIQREPFGTVVLPILSFLWMGWPLGFAHAPYNPYWADAHPRRASVMSAAGPAANLLLATFFFLVMKLGLSMHWFEFRLDPPRDGADLLAHIVVGADPEGGALSALATMTSVLFSINFILGVFNLIPLPPLDGAGIVEGLLGPVGAFYRLLRSNPMFSIVGIIIAWQIAAQVIVPPLNFALRLLRG